MLKGTDSRPLVKVLFKNLKTSLPVLKDLLEKTNDEWKGENGFYRFYHQSFKVFDLQYETQKIVKVLSALLPEQPLNEWFQQIILEGTGNEFNVKYNKNWIEETRSILEAYSHAKYFLEMAVKYGSILDEPPLFLPNGWAAFLYLYNLR